MNRVAAIFAAAWACSVVTGTAAPEGQGITRDLCFIANDHLKLGVDPGSGGAICWFGVAPDGPNLLIASALLELTTFAPLEKT